MQLYQMVSEQIERRGIHSPAVLKAMRSVERAVFVPDGAERFAYDDIALPIGYGQTISQPYIVALMTDLLQLTEHSRVLEIGTGSGYQTAVLARIAKEVYTIETVQELYERTNRLLKRLHYDNVTTRYGDGSAGWADAAPFDAIIVTAAAPHIPRVLVSQLADGGRMVVPVGKFLSYQRLCVIERKGDTLRVSRHAAVLFVPMTGAVADEKRKFR